MSFNPRFKINLIKVFNRALASKPRPVRDQLRQHLTNYSFRQSFGKAVIERIQYRTEVLGIDKNGRKFPSYSKVYVDSDVFKIYAKSAGHVNLTLTGEMMASMIAIDSSQSIVIEMIGDNNKAKAHGHKYGLGNKKVKRDFLGLPDGDLDKIMVETISEYQNSTLEAFQSLYEGKDGLDFNGAIGSQEFATGLDMNTILDMIYKGITDGTN